MKTKEENAGGFEFVSKPTLKGHNVFVRNSNKEEKVAEFCYGELIILNGCCVPVIEIERFVAENIEGNFILCAW